MKKLSIGSLLLIVLITLSATVCMGEEEKMTVISQQQSIDYINRVLTYQGEVKVTWKDYILTADRVEIYLTEENTLKKIIAEGKVTIKQDKTIEGSCQKVTYTAPDGLILLEGNVNYKDTLGNSLSADRVMVWTIERKIEAQGSPVSATYIISQGATSGTAGGESK